MPWRVDSLVAQIPQAIGRLAGKTPVASPARTRDWQRVPLAVRDRAFFSAGVTAIATLARARQLLDEWAALDPAQAFRDRSKFVAAMRQTLGAPAGDSGSLTDIASRRRLELIYQFQTTQAAEYARYVVGNDPAVLEAFPCQELVRIEARREPRDWLSRWQAAGGKLYGGRMIARKDDEVWARISRFGTPFPPFDFGSGMGVADVEREEAVALGVIPADYTPPQGGPLAGFNDKLEQSIADLDAKGQEDQARADLKALFGDQIVIEGDKVKWQGRLVQDFIEQTIADPSFKSEINLGAATPQAIAKAAGIQDLSGYRLTWLADDARHMWVGHGPQSGDPKPLNRLDFELLPHVWRDPDAISAGQKPGDLVFVKTILQRTVLVEWTRSEKNKLMLAKTLYHP